MQQEEKGGTEGEIEYKIHRQCISHMPSLNASESRFYDRRKEERKKDIPTLPTRSPNSPHLTCPNPSTEKEILPFQTCR